MNKDATSRVSNSLVAIYFPDGLIFKVVQAWYPISPTLTKLWRRKYIRITSSRDLILSEGEEIPQHIPPGDKSTWRWRINSDVRSVEIPDRDEEQLPHSLRIAVERGGAVCCLACQTAGDLINLRRGTHHLTVLIVVLGYCLNDDAIFSA